MNRVLVLGSSGSGKSTLAKALGQALDIEIIHLDSHFWQPNWQATPDEIWEIKLIELLNRPRWVMDGNYPSSLEKRLEYADSVVFIDYNRLVCLWRCVRRFLTYRGDNRPELAPGCDEKIDWDFFKWIWNYPRAVKPVVMDVLDKYVDDVQVTILENDRDVRAFLNQMADEACMNSNIRIQRTNALPPDLDTDLIPAATREAFNALEWLRDEWQAGTNRFSEPGESFYTARHEGRLVGVCGVNRDPYAEDHSVGRLRRLYVHPECRRKGVGRGLVLRAIEDSQDYFRAFHVRTLDPQASEFYIALGFVPVVGEQAVTHRLVLDTVTWSDVCPG